MKPKFLVRTSSYLSPVKAPFDICYLSDLHFNGHSGNMTEDLISYLEDSPPDLILLGGDYLDTRRGEPHFAALLSACSACCPTYAVGGNHDRFYGIDRIKVLCTCHGVVWLEQETTCVMVSGCTVQLFGGFIPAVVPLSKALSIVVLHKPVAPERLKGKCHLAFAGHLHGCKFVFWQCGFDLYPGRIFYRNNFIERRNGNLAYFISRGLGDTLPLRYNCPREVVRVVVNSDVI